MKHVGEDGGEWFLAIDGGGSKVAGIIAQSHSSPSAKVNSFRFSLAGVGSAADGSWDRARANIMAVVEDLLRQACIEADAVTHAVFMLAGAGRPQDVQRVSASCMQNSLLSRFRRLTITSDIMPLLVHAQQLEPHYANIVTIVGTGSLVAALDQHEQLIRAGGWGPILGDHGSGWRIAQAALTRVCNWIDRGIDSATGDEATLVAEVRQFLIDQQLLASDQKTSPSNRDDLCTALLKLASDRHLAAQLAPRIIELACTSGDVTCKLIVAEQIKSLCEQIACVHQRLQLNTQPWRLCTAGGLVGRQSEYSRLLIASLAEQGLAPTLNSVLEPLEAALTFARLKSNSHRPD